MKTIPSLFLLATILFAGMEEEKIDYAQYDTMSTNEIAKAIAYSISKNAPLQIDAATKLTRAFALKNKIVVYKQVNFKADKDVEYVWNNMPKKMKYAMFQQDSQIACYNKPLFYFITKKNVVVHQNYTDTNNKPLFDYTINKQDCLKLINKN